MRLSVFTATAWLGLFAAAHGQTPEAAQTFEARGELATEATPFILGGLRLDPARLNPVVGPVSRGSDVLTGQAAYYQTATVAETTESSAMLARIQLAAGPPLHRVEFVQRTRDDRLIVMRFWCGPMALEMRVFDRRPVFCVVPHGDGLSARHTRGQSWLAVSPRTASIEAHPFDRVPLQPTDPAEQPTTDIRFQLVGLGRRNLEIRIHARQGEHEMQIFSIRVPVENGVAVVPLWTHRLTLTVQDRQVVASLTADGNGSSLIDAGEYSNIP